MIAVSEPRVAAGDSALTGGTRRRPVGRGAHVSACAAVIDARGKIGFAAIGRVVITVSEAGIAAGDNALTGGTRSAALRFRNHRIRSRADIVEREDAGGAGIGDEGTTRNINERMGDGVPQLTTVPVIVVAVGNSPSKSVTDFQAGCLKIVSKLR